MAWKPLNQINLYGECDLYTLELHQSATWGQTNALSPRIAWLVAFVCFWLIKTKE